MCEQWANLAPDGTAHHVRPVPVSAPEPVPARRSRSVTATTRPRSPRPPSASARRSRSTSSAARLRRAGGLHSSKAAPSPPVLDRADSGPLVAFSSIHSVGMAGRPIPPSLQSEKRTQMPNLVAIAESPYHSDSAGPDSVLQPPWSAWRLRRPRRCCYGPLLRPATRRNLARASAHHLTTPRGPRDEALRNSATPTGASRRRIQAGGRQIRNPKSEIRNS